MILDDLIGEHVLSGVDMTSKSILQYDDQYKDCQVINFVLDGKTYTAIEDPEDGYRSCMKEIIESSEPVSNVFAGQRVLARMRDNGQYETNAILELIDMQTAKVVFAVGTGNTEDYYPYWVAEFTPENMSINAQKGGD